MKHDEHIIESVLQLKSLGIYSHQNIADMVGISKTSVSDIWARTVNKPVVDKTKIKVKLSPELQKLFKSNKEPKIALVDVETSASLVYCFGRFDQNIGQDNIYEEGGKILCAAYRWLGSKVVHSLYMTPEEIKAGDDSKVVSFLYHMYSEADAVVMHNAKKFDHKVIQTRLSFWNGIALPTVKVIDTLQIAKSKLRLPSNKLDCIGAYFGLGRKKDTEGIKLWAQVQQGCPLAMQKMVDYNKQDVNLLHEVYLELRGLGTGGTAYNAGLYYEDNEMHCKFCGSTDTELTGKTVKTSLKEFQEVHCNECGGKHRLRQNLVSKDKLQIQLS